MFEKMRAKWTKAIHPLVLKMGDLDPNVLTWTGLLLAIAAFYLLSGAGLDEAGAIAILGGVVLILVAGVLDALDGALARHQGIDGPYGDFLDHTIDRVVDVGLLVALGMNVAFVSDPRSGLLAGLLTLFGSYMGTQAQSVGLGRNYGGFGRADRLVTTFVGLFLGAIMAFNDTEDFGHLDIRADLFGLIPINALSAVLLISLAGGIWTFLKRAMASRRELLDGE